YSDGDYEDREDLIWNEADWQQFLIKNQQDINFFLEVYKRLRIAKGGHLDDVIKEMGWAPPQSSENEDSPYEDLFSDSQENTFFNEDDWHDAQDPFTIHKHPLFIATLGLYDLIKDYWETFMLKN